MVCFEFRLFLVSHSHSRSGCFFLELFARSAWFFDQLITWCVISFLITQYHLSMLLRLVHFIFFTRIQDRYHVFGTGQWPNKKYAIVKEQFYKVDIPVAVDPQRVLAWRVVSWNCAFSMRARSIWSFMACFSLELGNMRSYICAHQRPLFSW